MKLRISQFKRLVAGICFLVLPVLGSTSPGSTQGSGGFSEAGARDLLGRHDYQGCVNYCQEWLRVAPNEWNPNDYLGCAYYEMKQYEPAIKAFEAAIRIQPGTAYCYKQLALAEGYNLRFDLMLKAMHMGESAAASTFDYQMWRWYGAWYEKWGENDAAVHAWQQAYNMQPTPQAKLELAEAYYQKGRNEAFAQKLDDSERDLKTAIQMGDPKAPTYLKVVEKYHYVDKPKWQAQADREYKAWCEEQKKIVATQPVRPMINFGQLEFRRQTYQNAHPDCIYKTMSY